MITGHCATIKKKRWPAYFLHYRSKVTFISHLASLCIETPPVSQEILVGSTDLLSIIWEDSPKCQW